MQYWAALPKRVRCLALATVMVAAWCWPAPAQASCGDYVHVQSSPEADSSTPQASPSFPTGAPSRPRQPHQPGMPRPTCEGPQCSTPIAPVSAAPPAVERDDLRALTDASVTCADQSTRRLPVFDDRLAPCGYRSSIYHPPRA